MENIMHVGLDVDDKAFHLCGLGSLNDDVFELSCQPTRQALLKRLNELKAKGFKLKTCYEATYIGYSLHRFLISNNVDNMIVASSLIPYTPGVKMKTDRLDCRKLAKYSAKDLLTPIYIPDTADEQIRDFIRSRGFLVNKRCSLKKHILSISRRYGWDYKQESRGKNYWTQMHINWLRKKVKEADKVIGINLELLLSQYSYFTETIERYEAEILGYSELKSYKKRCEALSCFRGISTLSAMILLTEIGDIRRFSHPNYLTSYVGLGIKEYSSGGKERKFGITKMGNSHIRTVLVEACQHADKSYQLSKRLRMVRANQSQAILEVADRCMKRLQKKSLRLQQSNKHINKVKVACARELLSFIWEMLTRIEKTTRK